MELRESIEYINRRLIEEFGREFNNMPRWRVVFSDDQFEKRKVTVTEEGLNLMYPEVREMKRYNYIHQKYILERLIPVSNPELLTDISYEPAWVFMDKHGKYLPPFFDGCKFVVEAIQSQIDKAGTYVKYKDPRVDPEVRRKELKDMEDFLFADETPVGDALSYGYGTTVPEMPRTDKIEAVVEPVKEKSDA